MTLAHAGHWAVQLLYALPVLFVVGAIVWSKVQEKREAAAEREAAAQDDLPAERETAGEAAAEPNLDSEGRD